MATPDTGREQRVLVLASTARDAANSVVILSKAGLDGVACRSVAELCREIDAGAGVVMATEEALAHDKDGSLTDALDLQPPWSDLPVVVLTRGGQESPAALKTMRTLGNVMLLERPIRVFTLVTAAQTALRARNKQYQIRAQLEELRQTGVRKDDFLATLAHELRNPLAPVLNGLSIMKFSNDRGTRNQARLMMERQITHMARLIDDLMDVSRITRGKVELKKTHLDFRQVVESALELCQPLIEAAGHEFTLNAGDDPLPIEGDPTRLAQILANLLNNAIKYTPNGGHLWLDVAKDGNEVVVRVRDNGTGIPAEKLPEIFEMFTQVGRTIDRAQGGLGIGLTLVRRLVEMHGGTVTATSAGAGQGSTFEVRLPLADHAVPIIRTSSDLAEGEPKLKLRVLVVDDNVDGAESLAMMLEYSGYQTRTAHDGPAALESARTFHPDVFLLDIGLPGMNGYELATHLRRDPDHQGKTMVALTGWGTEADQQKAREAGFDFHLTKPAEAAAIERIFAEVRGSHRVSQLP